MALLAGGCGGSDDDASTGDAGSTTTASNATTVSVNAGPMGASSVDVPFISVAICVPGTSTCQTIDYVAVDTGSSGLRVLSSALPSAFTLPQVDATTGDPLVECFQFEDGYTWGSVRRADLKIGGEVASSVPIQIVGDPAFSTIPTSCSSTGPSEDTVASFGSNGLIGINQIVADCGALCADTANVQTGAYYSCSESTCAPVAVADADQIPNPISRFQGDNNGAILQFPGVAPGGSVTLDGLLVFGIGTHANNALGSATVQTLDQEGNFTTVFNGATLSQSYIDSGTNLLAFNDPSLTPCTGQLAGFYCPSAVASLSAQNIGLNKATTTVSFSVESAQTLFDDSADIAFDDLAGTGTDGTFAWGFPFFIGRNVFIALDGATTPGGAGPYVAY